ncbi:MAG: DUF3567 family protein [Betaproteobacteria bacterium]|nr:DUF3567 family protein [Betaproteobacteria bacterium]
MNILYDSSTWYVADYPGCGIELVDKSAGRGTFLEGSMANKVRMSMQHIFEDGPGVESMDEFLGYFDALLTTPLTLH